MKTYLVIQNVAAFRVDWRNLHRPGAYRLLLITRSKHHERLLAAGQDRCFARVLLTDDFSADGLSRTVAGLIQTLEPSERREVRLVTHDEYSLGVVAQVRALLGIEGDQPEAVSSFIDKLAMKRALEGKGIRLPRHLAFEPRRFQDAPQRYVDEVMEKLRLPLFVKPVNESGTVGARKLHTRDELLAWGSAYTGDTPFEIDEFVTGTLFECDSLIRDGKVVRTYVCEYPHPCYDYLSGRICGCVTLPKDSADFQRLEAFARQVNDAIEPKPRHMVTHLEVFKTPEDELVFLEIAARSPGAMVPFVYEKHLGVNLEEVYFNLKMELPFELPAARGPYSAFAYFPHRDGVVAQVIEPKLQSPFELKWNIKPGDVMRQDESVRDMACSVLLWNDDYARLRSDYRYLDQEYQPFSLVRGAQAGG